LVTLWELASGGCLNDLIPCRNVEELLTYLKPVAAAIDFINNQSTPVVHRDVKPQNILLVNGVGKLGDLGTARAEEAPFTTLTGAPCLVVAPPEGILHTVDRTYDLYSLAVTFVASLTRELPFGGTWGGAFDAQTLLARKRSREGIRSTLETLGFTGTALELLRAAVDPDDANRPQKGAEAWLSELELALSSRSVGRVDWLNAEPTHLHSGDTDPMISLDPELLVKLGLTSEIMQRLVEKSVGVAGDRLPQRLRNAMEIVGPFRAKQLAYEMSQAVQRVQHAVRRLRVKLATPAPIDSDWGLISYEYLEICAERDLLRTRIDDDCSTWGRYTELAAEVYRRLDDFCADVLTIARGYIPRSMLPDGHEFQSVPSLEHFHEKARYYTKAVETVSLEFSTWIDDCQRLYELHCTLLES